MEIRSFLLVICLFVGFSAATKSKPLRPDLGGCPTQCLNGPCGPGNDQCSAPYGPGAPQYHVRDKSCGINDPNFPFFDERHMLYHLMYQDHLAEYQNNYGQGPVIGHAISADLVHWAHLPVSLWNDEWYDIVAVYTGSATVVNGVPVLVYPGLCTSALGHNCSTGTTFAVALPANLDDPFLTNWTKPAYNPIFNNVQRDPSTAWQTPRGEWRFTNYEGRIYSSWDFVHWSDTGVLWDDAECPDMFPLPAVCPTCDLPPNTTLPTWVHKRSSGGDWYQLGDYSFGADNTTGAWTQTPGVNFDEQPVDYSLGTMGYYASKSFWDPVKQRRIIWGWAMISPGSAQTLPREVTYEPASQMLLFNPIEDLKALRTASLAKLSDVKLAPNSPVWLGNWPNQAGNQSEVHVVFALPTVPTAFGVTVMNGAVPGEGSGNASALVEIDFAPGLDASTPATAVVKVTPDSPPSHASWMPGTDLPGDDYSIVDVDYTDPKICQATCTADPACKAWTYVIRGPLYASCCLKASVISVDSNPLCTSGVKTGKLPVVSQYATLPLLATDATIDIRVFVDNTFIEVFVAGGRICLTAELNVWQNAANGMTVYSNTTLAVQKAEAWSIGPIWVSPEEVLARRKRRV